MGSARSAVSELARIVVHAALPDRPDIASVDDLSEAAGLTRRVQQYRCQAAGVTARNCVYLVQCLHALLMAIDAEWDPAPLVPSCDPRTLQKLVTLAGFYGERRPDLDEFIARQQFCKSEWFRAAVLAELDSALRSSHLAHSCSR